jgi:glutathione S-transferase
MLQLCGFPLSNYYNKVKLALLEFGIPFEEDVLGLPLADQASLAASPFGKVPFLRTESGPISESQAIIEYLAARYPEQGVFPADPYAAAKVRELITCIELYIELPAREVYPEAFFGGTVSDGTKRRVETRLVHALGALKQLTHFTPYAYGEAFGIADVAAYVHLPLVGLATKQVFGRDMVLEAGIDWKDYAKRLGERPAVRRVAEERKAFQEANR